MTAQHEHTWEATGIAWGAVGRKWQQGGEWHYCAGCGKWGVKKTLFLDGDFFKTDAEARRQNDNVERQMALERADWLRERDPELAP